MVVVVVRRDFASGRPRGTKKLVKVGIEPTPPKRCNLELSAMDHSAIQPTMIDSLPMQSVATALGVH